MGESKDDFLESFCKGVLAKDHFIRFAGVSNHFGHLIATAYRQGLKPLMTHEETLCSSGGNPRGHEGNL